MAGFSITYSLQNNQNDLGQIVSTFPKIVEIRHAKSFICCSCEQFEKEPGDGEGEYIDLGDGRSVCPDCYSTAVLDSKKLEPLFRKICEFYRSLDLQIDPNTPILLTDKYEISKRFVEKGAYIHREDWWHGVTLYKPVDKTIMSIESSSLEGGKIKTTKVQRKQPKHKETLVLLLFGFSEVVTGATLAHEMMHVWLSRKGCNKLKEEVSEGICEVMAYNWLEWCSTHSNYNGQNPFVQNLIQRHKASTAKYIGFKDAQNAVQKYGLNRTLDYIVKKGKIPK